MTRRMFWLSAALRVMWVTWKKPRITARNTMKPHRTIRSPVGVVTPV